MTPFSSDPLVLGHVECQGVWDMYCAEQPPRITVCTNCGKPLRLVGHDTDTNSFVYQNITP